MKLDSLEQLHASMQAISTEEDPVDVQHFRVTMGAVEFDCLFSVRGRPYTLSLTSRGENPEFFQFEISRQYEIANGMAPDVYQRLAKKLRTTGKSGNKLVPRDFFAELNDRIPRRAEGRRVPTPEQMIRLRPDITEERESPYFSHWRDPGKKRDGTPANVTEENMKKTLEMLGTDALDTASPITSHRAGVRSSSGAAGDRTEAEKEQHWMLSEQAWNLGHCGRPNGVLAVLTTTLRLLY